MPENSSMNQDAMLPGTEIAEQKLQDEKNRAKKLELSDSNKEHEMTQQEHSDLIGKISSFKLEGVQKAFKAYEQVNTSTANLSAREYKDINYNAVVNMATNKPSQITELANLAERYLKAANSKSNFPEGDSGIDYQNARDDFRRNAEKLGYENKGWFFGEGELAKLAVFLNEYKTAQEALSSADLGTKIKFLVDFNKDSAIKGSKTMFNSEKDGTSGMPFSESQLLHSLQENGQISPKKVENLLRNIGLPENFLNNLDKAPLSLARNFMAYQCFHG